MKVNYVNRTSVIRNSIMLILLTPYFLFVIESLDTGTSALRVPLLLEFLFDNKIIVGLCVATAFIQFLGFFFARYLYWVCSLFVIFKGLSIFAVTFDKPILILTSFYLVLVYLTFLLWMKELEEAPYRPSFSRNSIYKKSNYNFPVVLNSPSGRWEGYLTNWDEDGCFFYTEDQINTGSNIEMAITYEEMEFKTPGKVVTKYGNGVGIKIKNRKKVEGPNWDDFYDIISSRGYSAS